MIKEDVIKALKKTELVLIIKKNGRKIRVRSKWVICIEDGIKIPLKKAPVIILFDEILGITNLEKESKSSKYKQAPFYMKRILIACGLVLIIFGAWFFISNESIEKKQNNDLLTPKPTKSSEKIQNHNGSSISKWQPPLKTSKPIDLIELMKSAGFYVEYEWDWAFDKFVRFGNKIKSDEFANADMFDRNKIKKTLASHEAEVKKGFFVVKNLYFTANTPDNFETAGTVLTLNVPMRIRGDLPFYEDKTSCFGSLIEIHPSEINLGSYAYLTKNGTLQECASRDIQYIKENNGVIYLPESRNTTLAMFIKGHIDLIKDLTLKTSDYTIEIEFNDLHISKPLFWGYFKQDTWRKLNFDCQKLYIEHLRSIANNKILEQPNYFATHAYASESEEYEIPEIIWAKLISLKIIYKDGKVIGGYSIQR